MMSASVMKELNALLCGSNEFNGKINKEIPHSIIPNRADDTGWGGRGGSMAPTYFCSKNKKGKQSKRRKSFKAETIKRL